MTAALLEVRDLTKQYRDHAVGDRLARRVRREPPLMPAVQNVSLSVQAGDTVGIVGETGSGKSTLAQCIVGLMRPTSGTVLLDGKELKHSRRARKTRALDVQMVFQDPYSSLNPRRRVGSILRESLRVHDLLPRAKHGARVDELLELVGLPADVAERYPRDLSGGQRQRVAIARALAFEPKLIVADEVVSALDAAIQAQILNLLRDLQEQTGTALVVISHNLAVVRYLCRWTVVMYRGQVVEAGPSEQVLDDPQHAYTRALLSAVLSVDAPQAPPSPT